MILAGDIGATKTRLALYDFENDMLVRKEVQTFVSREFNTFEEVMEKFLSETRANVNKACVGVPGPIINGQAQATNLLWKIKEQSISQTLQIDKVKLVNDLVATTTSVLFLSSEQTHVLYEGKERERTDEVNAVLAPGTGLGQAFLTWKSGEFQVHPSEGGHVDFAPTNDIEIELLRFLRSKFERVSYERVVCGPGLVNIYTFLKHIQYAPEPEELRRRLKSEDPAAVISETGQAGEYKLCEKALDIFASVLGAQAGNLVISLLATGGIYLGGGIPPKIIKKLSDGTTVKSYLNKDRLSHLVEATPLYVIKDDQAPLLGAAHLASAL